MKLGKEVRTAVFVFGLFTLVSLILFWPIFLGKVNLNGNLLTSFYPPYGENLPFKNTGWDQLRIYFPFYKVTFDAFKSFSIPFWNPWAFSGHVHMADFQSGVFYPLNIFGLALSQVAFWHFLRVSPMVLGAFFTYLFLRNRKISFVAAFFGSFAFGFSPFILTWGEEVVLSVHSIIWLPLVLLGIDKYIFSRSKKYLFLVAFAVAFSLLGGYMQTSIYLLIFVFCYLILVFWRRLFSRAAFALFTALIIGIFLTGLQLLPSAQLFFNAARSQIKLTSALYDFLLPINSLLTYLAPDIFGSPATNNYFRGGSAQYYEGILFAGIAVLVFAIYRVFCIKRDKFSIFLILVFLVSLSSTLDLPTSWLFLNLPIPFLSTSIANRVLFIPLFCLIILAALGMDDFLKSRGKQMLIVVLRIFALYLTLFAYVFGVIHFKFYNLGIFTAVNANIALRNLVLPLAVFLVTAFLIIFAVFVPKWRNLAMFCIVGVAVLHVFYFSNKYFSFTDKQYIFPQSPVLDFISQNQGFDRSWGFGDSYFENNFASQYSIYWPEGYDSLNNRSYGEFTAAMQNYGDVSGVFRADAGLGRGNGSELLASTDRRRLIDLVGVKYVIAQSKDFLLLEKNNFEMVFDAGADKHGRHYAVFENRQAVPRVFLASNYEGPPDVNPMGKTADQIKVERRALIVKALLADNFDFRNKLILEEPSTISPQFGSGSAQIISYKPTQVIIKTSSSEPKLLFLSDNYYPGWKVMVDGEQSKILRADYTFRAVALGPGEHMVEFYYASDAFLWGLALSLMSLVALGYITLAKNPLTG